MPTKTQSAFVSGQRVGKFKIVREIGKGGMGVVYLAEDVSLARVVAIKVLHDVSSTDTGFRERAIQEARSSAALQHPHIVRVNSFDEIDGQLLIEMEYAEGGSLADLMFSGALAPQHVALLAHQVFQALARCHREGIVHRDLKPSNILLDREGRALLSDFGLAKVLSASQQKAMLSTASSVMFVGTPRYAPPEAWDGAEPSAAWDIYSFGMVLYEALSGRVPYDALTPLALAKQIASAPIKSLRETAPNASPQFADLIHDMLTPDPKVRPTDAVALLDRLVAAPELIECGLTSITIIPRASAASRLKRAVRRARNYVNTFPAQRAFALGIALAALATFAVVAVVRSELVSKQTKNLPQLRDTGVTLNSALQQTVLDLSQFPLYRRVVGTGAPVIFSAHILQEGGTLDPSWIVFPSANPLEREVFAYTPNAIWSLTMKSQADKAIGFEGNWAEYRKDGRVFRSGTIGGNGFWVEPNRSLSASLDFQSLDDGASWTWAVTATESALCLTDTDFLYRFEDQPILQSLLFDQLIPRQATWAGRIEQRLPVVEGGRLVLAYEPSAADRILVDGRIDEDIWKGDYYTSQGRIGRLAGYPQSAKPVAEALYCDTGVYFAFTAKPRDLQVHPAFRLSLARSIGSSDTSSERIELSFDANAAMTIQKLRNGREVALEESWKAVYASNDGTTEVEIFVPGEFAKPAEPIRNERWRIAAVFAPAFTEKPVCFWGVPNTESLAHGAIIEFADQGRQLAPAPATPPKNTGAPN